MAESFYTILTNVGKAKIANATALGTKVNFTTLKVGDSNGTYYNPTEAQQNLVHTVWQGNINSIKVDAENPNWLIIEIVIPSSEGGFVIREVGIFDDEGDLLAIGKYPETYKPQVADGSTKDITIRMILEVSNPATVTLKVDPTVTLATQEDIQVLRNQINTNTTSINNLAGSGRTTETVKGNSDAIVNLGGAGRTTETVKGNADAIAGLIEEVNDNKTDLASQDVNKGASLIGIHDTNSQFTSTNVEGALNELAARPQKDVDNGRYQSEFGLEDAVLSGCYLVSNNILLEKSNVTSTIDVTGISVSTGQDSAKTGVVFIPKSNLSSITVTKNNSSTASYVYIINKATGTILSTQAISTSAVTINYSFQANTEYVIAFDNAGSNYTTTNCSTTSFPYNTDLFSITTGYYNGNTVGGFYNLLKVSSTATSKFLSGTATKTYAPTDLKKWGNVKVMVANLGANNSATLTVKSNSDVQLKAPVSLNNGDNYIDISNISSSTYTNLKSEFTLNRNSTSDLAPIIKSVSVTWEGKLNTRAGDWEQIAETIPAVNIGQIDFINLQNYRLLKIFAELRCTTSNAYAHINFNDDTTVYYKKGTTTATNGIQLTIATNTSPYHSMAELIMSNRINTDQKTGMLRESVDGQSQAANYGVSWLNTTDIINKISVIANSGLIEANSRIVLWGCK